MIESGWRLPNERENNVIDQLVAGMGDSAIARQQWNRALVRTIDSDGCFEIQPERDSPRLPFSGLAVEGAATTPANVVPVSALLHVRDGLLAELEIYVPDGTPVDDSFWTRTLDVWSGA